MAWNASVLTAVLLGLVVPPGGALRAVAPVEDTPSKVVQRSSPAGIVERVPTRAVRRRDQETPGKSTITRELLADAGEYMRCRNSGSAPSAKAAAAWAEFYPRCDQLVRAYCGKFAGRGVDVDDASQETWSHLLRILPEFRLNSSRGQFSSWLYTVVRSKTTDLLRRSVRRRADSISPEIAASLIETDGDPVLAIDRKLDVEQMRGALEQLRAGSSEQSYRVLHLRHIEDLSVGEVAQKMDISVEQVWARDHRMRSRLRQILGNAE